MPRSKAKSDTEILAVAYRLIHAVGPESLTFGALSAACGLSPATLVQRFGSKAILVQRTLLHAWDQLDARTTELADRVPKTPRGAVRMLVTLSGSYGGIEAYADGLMVLREDFRDPVLRARGGRWHRALVNALEACFAGTSASSDIGEILASLWQGSLLWWGFESKKNLPRYVEDSLLRYLRAILPAAKL